MAKNLADRVAKSLMLKYGCRLTDGEVCRGYELKVDDPVARLLARYFCVSTPERKIDHSPGVSHGELEHFGRDAAVEYLLMPERVKKLEGQVHVLHVDLEELTEALKKFLNVEDSGQSVPESQKSKEDSFHDTINRVRKAKKRVECKLEKELVDRIDRLAELLMTNRTDIIRNACMAYLKTWRQKDRGC